MGFLESLLKLFHPAVPKPSFTEFVLSGDHVASLCMDAKDHVYIWDNKYYALSMADWQTVFKDVLSNLPKYKIDRQDCEDFAFEVMVRVTERYEINTCGVAVGQSPMGYHGFNLFITKFQDKFTLHALEPQTGAIDPSEYVAETVIFG